MSGSILDVCCGGRMFWFDKENPNVVFGDIRDGSYQMKDGDKMRTLDVHPDIIMDFRDIPFADGWFNLVVFDPPHMKRLGENSWMAKKYGKLSENWQEDIKKGFAECFRVLKVGGVLIFKWNEYDIPLREILALTPHKPLFGDPSGKMQKTHWVCFVKFEENGE